jgi:hypothetical protein
MTLRRVALRPVRGLHERQRAVLVALVEEQRNVHLQDSGERRLERGLHRSLRQVETEVVHVLLRVDRPPDGLPQGERGGLVGRVVRLALLAPVVGDGPGGEAVGLVRVLELPHPLAVHLAERALHLHEALLVAGHAVQPLRLLHRAVVGALEHLLRPGFAPGSTTESWRSSFSTPLSSKRTRDGCAGRTT